MFLFSYRSDFGCKYSDSCSVLHSYSLSLGQSGDSSRDHCIKGTNIL
uniref:Uncharacterized protein n=1 Tax=Anguilla anguilla TaxID=7936 RepID=A0A0E9REF9_ANGAN